MGRFCATCGTYLSNADSTCACTDQTAKVRSAEDTSPLTPGPTPETEQTLASSTSFESGIFVAEVATENEPSAPVVEAIAEVIVLEQAAMTPTAANVNQGSPFRLDAAKLGSNSPNTFASIDRYAARGGAIGSVLAGVITTIGGIFCSSSAIVGMGGLCCVAILGMAAGFFGLMSDFRKRSMAGVALSALAIFVLFLKPILLLF